MGLKSFVEGLRVLEKINKKDYQGNDVVTLCTYKDGQVWKVSNVPPDVAAGIAVDDVIDINVSISTFASNGRSYLTIKYVPAE